MKLGNNGNYCVKTLKGLNKISEDGRLTTDLKVGVSQLLRNMSNKFKDALKTQKQFV